MTKEELREKLEHGAVMDELFRFREGQECDIFKEEAFRAGDQIIYIPDTHLNEIPTFRSMKDGGEIEEVLDCCYTGNDFIRLCEEHFGSGEKASELFDYVDWQHPSSALDAGEIDDDEET